ncbi:heterogeneous nuclear ribonucleoprotein Q-like [Iris pallida]|uniref:Heterogeneous nuclear ribonucleoprotein Q-like n=1 Tax=Iris pallida TaxID=29817 RepID=A0AAX6FH39_IRIPA|nr:heterogeneous nuclear ribonucleoprotein Q-like [Iris pallida]
MPPRKKIVRKTVRKTKPKTPTATASVSDNETSTTDTPVSVPDTEIPTDTPVSLPDTESPTDTPVPAPDTETHIDTPKPLEPTAEESPIPEPATTETLAEEPATAETLAEEPATTETLAEEPAPAETLAEEPASTETLAEEQTAPETLELETVVAAEEPAAGTTLAEEQTVPEILELETVVAAEEPAAGTAAEPLEPATKTKKVLRVRKVVKKKIVKKLVPKSSLAAAASGAAAEGDGKEVQAEEVSVSEEQHELGNPISDAASAKVEEVLEKADIGSGGDGEKEHVEETAAAGDGEGLPERSKRKNTEVFVGGLDRDAKEDDLRKVFGKAGEIVDVRMIMDGQSGKNKGYAFVRYADASMAKKAVSEFEKVEVCGKLCGASALKDNDTIFLGNIDKKWKKEDIIKMLQEVGIEKIETVTVMADSNNSDMNRGYAFLELESNKDAQIAYKKLQKKDAFGKGRNIKVAWAEPLIVPDEEEVKKVKSVYVEGIPSWDEEKVRETFTKFGEIERVVLARNMKSAKRKDFAFVNYTTREAALLCLESFDKESNDDDSKVTVKVSMAKPVQKAKQNKGGSKSSDKDNITEKPKAIQRHTKANVSSTKGKSFKGGHTSNVDKMSSTTHNLSNVIRQQATWKQGQAGYAGGPTMHDYRHGSGGKRPFSSLGDETLYPDLRGYQRARLDSSFPSAGPSYGAMPHGAVGSSFPYYQHQGTGYAPGSLWCYRLYRHASDEARTSSVWKQLLFPILKR